MALPYDPYVNQFISGRQWATDTYNTAGGGDAGASSIATTLSQITPEDFANYSPNDQGLIYQILTGAGLPTSSLNYSPTTSPFGLSSGLNINPSLSGPNPDLQVFNTGNLDWQQPYINANGMFIDPMHTQWDLSRLTQPGSGTGSSASPNYNLGGTYEQYLNDYYNWWNNLSDIDRTRQFHIGNVGPYSEAGWNNYKITQPAALKAWENYDADLIAGHTNPDGTPISLVSGTNAGATSTAPTAPTTTTTPAVTPPTTNTTVNNSPAFNNTNVNTNQGNQARPFLNLGSGNNNPNFGGQNPAGGGGGMNDFTKAGGNTNWWEM